MSQVIFDATRPKELRKAGPTDMVRLSPAPGANALFFEKATLDTIIYGITHQEFIHLSGPTGAAKTSLVDNLDRVPENFRGLCTGLGFPVLPLRLFSTEMACYETSAEIFHRRSLKDGSTYDEESQIIYALREASKVRGSCYPLIWLREIGRTHSSSVQGGLLNIMTGGDIVLPGGARIDGGGIAWLADSNYASERDSTYVLCTFDTALKRRFSINVFVDYLSPDREAQILEHILHNDESWNIDDKIRELIAQVVKLGAVIRQNQSQGNLLSASPPTIYGYLALLRMWKAMPHLSLQQSVQSSLLGNTSMEDRKIVASVFNEVFGLKVEQDDDPALGGDLF